jgi:hypothetical protein
VCGTYRFSGFTEFFAHVFGKHSQIIRTHSSQLFNTADNLDYVGPYSEPKYYGTDFMSGDERAQFLELYEEQKVKFFRNKEELLSYCMDDVSVLKQACWPFRILFWKLVKMDPFLQAITIPSICNKVFRTMFLKPDNAGLIPGGAPNGRSPVC